MVILSTVFIYLVKTLLMIVRVETFLYRSKREKKKKENYAQYNQMQTAARIWPIVLVHKETVLAPKIFDTQIVCAIKTTRL